NQVQQLGRQCLHTDDSSWWSFLPKLTRPAITFSKIKIGQSRVIIPVLILRRDVNAIKQQAIAEQCGVNRDHFRPARDRRAACHDQ
ncbi:MAG: hypothetical protein ACREAB_01235, partial [Blastocatellia bacterium]